ncbi:hypothetical protein HPG69_002000 [Diceros bicornis minor]|uniref:Uncharacterized protein n=1 Tax=Diceros bicornis minor TaxID=77932 RepID=A0A7J7FBW1_DICBM|nr:hypothetical protein HPG69_002000 [Diceros bicornis minor]
MCQQPLYDVALKEELKSNKFFSLPTVCFLTLTRKTQTLGCKTGKD